MFEVLLVPLGIWLASYVYLARFHRRWNLLRVKVHESGKYTLLGTVFYFDHFLREVPVDTMYVLAIYWAYTSIGPPGPEAIGLTSSAPLFQVGLVVFLIAVFVGSTLRVGFATSLLDLLQFRERDTIVRFGSHWQMHFLSTIGLMMIFMFPGTLFASADFRSGGYLLLLFVLVSLILGTDLRAITDRRWLLHGGREILTFVAIAGVPAFVWMAGGVEPSTLSLSAATIVGGIAIACLGAYYLWVLVNSNVKEAAETDLPAAYLIASHFFEHMLDVPFMALLMLVLVSW